MARWWPGLVFALWFMACAGLWYGMNQPVAAVRVQGALRVQERDEIQQVLVGLVGKRLLDLDVYAVKQQVMDLTWPQEVSVRRVWPDTLVIQVKRQVAVASWGSEGYLTSNGGVVQLPEAPGQLPRLECRHSEPVVALEIFRRLNQSARDRGVVLVALSENELGEWQVELAQGPQIMLGSVALLQTRSSAPALLAERFGRYFLLLTTLADGSESVHSVAREAAYVDARYTSGLAVRWRTLSTASHFEDPIH